MNRELKFRCWNNCSREYIPQDELMDNFGEYLKEEHLYIEQYTGLKDKNGKEIYEWDICRLAYYAKGKTNKRWHKEYEDIERVEFEDGYFKFSNTDQYGIGSELAFSDYGEWSTDGGQYKYEAEVIGNIHENPELLGEEQ